MYILFPFQANGERANQSFREGFSGSQNKVS
jgi:hypothetical protein